MSIGFHPKCFFYPLSHMSPDDAETLISHPSFCGTLAPSGNWQAPSGWILAFAAWVVHTLTFLTLMLFHARVILLGYKQGDSRIYFQDLSSQISDLSLISDLKMSSQKDNSRPSALGGKQSQLFLCLDCFLAAFMCF